MAAPPFLFVLTALFVLLANAGKSGKGGKSGNSNEDPMEKLMKSMGPEQKDKLTQMLTPEMQGKMNKMMAGEDSKDMTKLLKSMMLTSINSDETVSTEPAPVIPMTIKKARSMISEFHSALTSRAARRAFEKRLDKSNGDQEKDEKDEKVHRKEMLEKMSPLAEIYVNDILEKYGFKSGPGAGGQWGFQHAVRSALEAGVGKGKFDKQIAAATDDFEGVLLGTGSQLGRISALDSLAEKFVGMDAADRKKAIKTAKTTTDGEVYVQTMKNVAKKGDMYIVEAYKNLREHLEDEEDPKTKNELRARLNVLREFMRDEHHEKTQKDTSEL